MRKCAFAMRHCAFPTLFESMRTSSSLPYSKHGNRRRALAELAETLFDIQTEIEDKRREQGAQREAECRARVWEQSLDEQRRHFMKSEGIRRQILVLGKSESSVRIMMQSIDERAEIERVRTMLDKTIHQQAQQDLGERRAEGRELLEQVETMSTYIDQSHDAMDTIAGLSDDRQSHIDLSNSTDLALKAEFISWQAEVMAAGGSAPQEVPEVARPVFQNSLVPAMA